MEKQSKEAKTFSGQTVNLSVHWLKSRLEGETA
jgi:hypothetical protein